MCSFTSLAKEKEKSPWDHVFYRSWNFILACRAVFLQTQGFVFSKELLHDNCNSSKIHFKQLFYECSLIKLQIFKCIWEINTDQELSGLFVFSETGKSFCSLLCSGWIFSNRMYLAFPVQFQCSFFVQLCCSQPQEDDCSPGAIQYWWGFQNAVVPFPAWVKQQQLPIKFVIGF